MRLVAPILAALSLAAAPAASAGNVPLSSLLGHSIEVGGVALDFLTYTATGGAPAAADVAVVFPPPGSGVPGFTLDGAFGAPAGRASDATLFVTATGPVLEGATLSGNPLSPGGSGLAIATDTFHAGPSSTGPDLGQIGIASLNPPGPGPVALAFASRSVVTLVEDITALGGTRGVGISQAATTFVVAEPRAAALLLTGSLLPIIVLWRGRRGRPAARPRRGA